jgi:voltage-gated sodium channel
MTIVTNTSPKWKIYIEHFLAQPIVQHGIVALIFLNAALLGMETSPWIMGQIGETLHILDHTILYIFITELVLLMLARGLNFFKDPWCIFDFVVIAIAIVPASESLAVLRSLRVLRVLRLINKVESMKKVVRGLLGSLASLGSVMGLLLIVFYVASVVSTNLFGKEFPDYFGTLGASLFTLFQIMTLENWADGIARPIMEKFPLAWIFFLVYIMLSTFVVINLFVAAIVDAFSSISHADAAEKKEIEDEKLRELKEQRIFAQLSDEFKLIKTEVHNIKILLSGSPPK